MNAPIDEQDGVKKELPVCSAAKLNMPEDSIETEVNVQAEAEDVNVSLKHWLEADLAKSGLAVSDLENIGGYITTDKDIKHLLGFLPNCGSNPVEGYVLPFRDPVDGTPMKTLDGGTYLRVRLHYPAHGGSAKYLSAKDAGQHAFILPEVHKHLLAGIKNPVVVTEGEKKAMCMTKNGIPAIGLPGNWGWSITGTKPQELLPELGRYAVSGREFVVIWDSDALDDIRSAQFMASTNQLALTLKGKGCKLRVVWLPSVSPSGKTGADDFIMTSGTEALKGLIDHAESVHVDGRSQTSAANGQQGGRPPLVKDLSDTIAGEFIDGEGNKLLAYYIGKWYIYANGYYRRMMDDEMEGIVMSLIRKIAPGNATPNMVHSVLCNLRAKDMFYVPGNLKPPFIRSTEKEVGHLIVFKNGILDISKIAEALKNEQRVELLPLTPDCFAINQLPFNYDQHATCPKFSRYLQEVQPLEEVRLVLQKTMGLMLTPDTSFNVFFFFYGLPGAGKSVFVDVMVDVVGKNNVCCVPLSQFNDRFAIGALTEHLLNAIGDMPTETGDGDMMRNKEGMMKDVTDGGLLPVEYKGKDRYYAKATARNVFASNTLPRFADRSNGIWDRMRIIPFDVVFRNTEKDNPHLRDEIIAEELPGVLNWALAGLVALQNEKHFPETQRGKELKVQHRLTCDTEAQFLKESVVENADGQISVAHLYRMYRDYCWHNGYCARHSANFNDAVIRGFPRVVKRRSQVGGSREVVWEGLALVGLETELQK